MINNTKRGLYIFLSCATFNIVILSLYFILKDKAFAFIDIGADTYTYYYPLQMEFAKQLHDMHLLTWSFSAGLGNYFAWQSNIIFVLDGLFPQTWQLGLRLPTYMMVLLLAGALMYGYLRKLDFDPLIATAGALAFTFCDYATINSQWDTQGYVLAQLAAYLFCFECYFQNRKPIYAISAGLIVATGNTFDTYTFTLLTLFYVVTRPFFSPKGANAAPYIQSLLRYAGWAALGSMLASITLIPKLIYLLSSSRVSGDSSNFDSIISNSLSLTNIHEFGAEIAGLLGKNIFGVGSNFKGIINWFEAPGFYVSVLLLTCIPQLFAPNASKKERRVGLTGLALLAFYLISPLIRYAAYGFGHEGYRFSTLLVSLGVLMLGITGLRHIYCRGTWRVGLVIGTAIITLLTLTIAFINKSTVDMQHVALLLTFAAGYCFFLWPTASGKPKVALLTIVVVLTGELLFFSLPSFTNRSPVDINAIAGVDQQGADTLASIKFIKAREPSDKLFRIAKTYGQGFPNEPLVMGYNGTTSYFLQDKSTTSFIEDMSLQPRPVSNIIAPIVNRPMILDLLGVRYILTTDQEPPPNTQSSYIKGIGGVKIYLNDNIHGIARLYDSLISEADANALSVSDRDKLLMERVVVNDPSAIQEKLTALRAGNSDPVESAESVSVLKLSDTHLVGHANTVSPRVMLIAIPFNEGWSATIDSAKAPLFRADYGLTALVVPTGSHGIELRYSPPGRIIGAWLSIIACLLVISYFMLTFIRRRKPVHG